MRAPRKKTPPPEHGKHAWLTLPEAATLLGESRLKVLGRVLDGDLVAERRAGNTYISRESLERLCANAA